MYPHRIRLRGPWECEPIAPSLAPRRVTMPAGWIASGLGGFVGDARFTRRFGYPGRIDDGEHVWLMGDNARGLREIRLNDHILAHAPEIDHFACDVTSLLAQRNRLEITLHADSDDVGLWGEIALEIRRDAYLADVAVDRCADVVVVTGAVVGMAPQPLELYTLIDGRHADYRLVEPGQAIRVTLTEVAESSQLVRVELIRVSSIWYAVELPIPPSHPA